MELQNRAIEFKYSDGGRSKYFKAKSVGDCVCRAICNATGKDYKEVYNRLAEGNATQRRSNRESSSKARTKRRTAQNGIFTKRKWFKDYMKELGFEWVSVMGVGTGVTMHVRQNEVPEGTIVARLSRHLTCIKDGVLIDTYDCSREGDRAIYGYWKLKA